MWVQFPFSLMKNLIFSKIFNQSSIIFLTNSTSSGLLQYARICQYSKFLCSVNWTRYRGQIRFNASLSLIGAQNVSTLNKDRENISLSEKYSDQGFPPGILYDSTGETRIIVERVLQLIATNTHDVMELKQILKGLQELLDRLSLVNKKGYINTLDMKEIPVYEDIYSTISKSSTRSLKLVLSNCQNLYILHILLLTTFVQEKMNWLDEEKLVISGITALTDEE